MKKKSIVCGVLASSIAVAATFGGCSLISTNPAADMNQIIATVDISKSAALDKEFGDYKDAVAAVGTVSIIKRELVAYFISYGYTYTQNYGMSTAEAFEYLLDSLIDNAVLVQYSTMYLLKAKAEEEPDAISKFIEASKQGDAEKYEYLLGEDSKEVKMAEYNLCLAINNSIDTQEKKILGEDSTTSGTDTRTAPDGVDTQKDNYYPQVSETDDSLNYNIYTGYAGYTIADSGAYEKDKLEGTTNATRIRAYNEFIKSLTSSSYDLVDTQKEDLRKVRELEYVNYEYISRLQQCVIDKYYEVYEEEQDYYLKQLDDEHDDYSAIDAAYNNLLKSHTESFNDDESNFTSSMDSLSDTSFVLYAPDTDDTKSGGRFGYVYNILLPFSDSQSDELTKLQNMYEDSDLDGGYKPEYYVERSSLMSQIKTTDQRSAWFNGETEYAFDASTNEALNYFNNGNNSTWLFFENNVSNFDKCEALEKYAGLYPYNGKVTAKENDYLLIPNELDIDGMLDEFVNYIDFVMGNNEGTTKWASDSKYSTLTTENIYKKVNGKEVIDYSYFVYANGKVNFGANNTEAYNRANLLDKNSAQYKALSAVNELQYAYTTDTGVLSQYLGYSVQAGDTSYIKEFEYAAHEAVKNGAGTFYVCAGDYGWHLIYVTYTFDAGEAQFEPDWATNIDVEGTFENLFYEWYKSENLPNITSSRQDGILTDFKIDSTVTKYESRYKNLLELD